jgi:hypothetical protein
MTTATISAKGYTNEDGVLMSRYSIRCNDIPIAADKRPTNDVQQAAVEQFGRISARSIGEIVAVIQALEALTDASVCAVTDRVSIHVSTALAWKILTQPVSTIAVHATHARHCHEQIHTIIDKLHKYMTVEVLRTKGATVIDSRII